MDSLSDSYQKYVKEIQFLKKQISAEKNAHENSLKQLQNTYQIIDELKEMLRMEQNTNLKLKGQVADKSSKITNISIQYQEQIAGIKEMIGLKDEELRRMSSALLVSDVDLIRLKVVNQLQLSHKEEMEALNREIHKRDVQLAQVKSKNKLLQQKNGYLSEEMKKQEEQAQYRHEELNRKYMSQIKDIYETAERNKSDSDKWRKKHQILDKKLRNQAEHFRDEINKLNRELEVENRAMLANGNSKSHKVKIEKLQEQIMKIQDEFNQERDAGRKLENQIATVKRENKILKLNQVELKNDKEKLEDLVGQLRREMQNRQSQKARQINSIRKQYENDGKEDLSKGLREKINLLQAENRKNQNTIESQKQELILLKQKANEGGNFTSIRKELDEKNKEIQKLILQVDSCKKRDRTKSGYQGKDDSAFVKSKLAEANHKIVSLLKEKIQMQKELQQLKGDHSR